MSTKALNLQILFFRLYREYSSQRLLKLQYYSVARSNKYKSFNDLNDPNSLPLYSELDEIANSLKGDIKLFGEDSLFFNDAKYVWLDEHALLNKLFFTYSEFMYFLEMFYEYVGLEWQSNTYSFKNNWDSTEFTVERFVKDMVDIIE